VKVSAFWHWNPLQRWLAGLLNEHGQVMSHLEDADNLNSATGKLLCPVVQSVNPNVKVMASESGADLARLSNANQGDALTH
jgi:hypothetical protein